jgi:ABC-type methionine transport system permease subunit
VKAIIVIFVDPPTWPSGSLGGYCFIRNFSTIESYEQWGCIMKKKLKKFFLVLYISVLFILFSGLIFIAWLTLADEEALVDSKIVNFIAIFAIFLSLPGAFMQLITMILPEKKKLIVKQKCPNCKHLIEYQIEER